MDMERTYGSRYAETAGESTTQIAARVRADVKAAIKAGKLPAGTKVSVRSEYYSGGSAIRVAIVRWPGRTANQERARVAVIRGVGYGDYGIPWSLYPEHSDELRLAVARLGDIMAAYNYDGSDSMTDHYDVRFSGHPTIDLGKDDRDGGIAAAMLEAAEALEAERLERERAAGEAVGAALTSAAL
jgi:hypothetical protein